MIVTGQLSKPKDNSIYNRWGPKGIISAVKWFHHMSRTIKLHNSKKSTPTESNNLEGTLAQDKNWRDGGSSKKFRWNKFQYRRGGRLQQPKKEITEFDFKEIGHSRIMSKTTILEEESFKLAG